MSRKEIKIKFLGTYNQNGGYIHNTVYQILKDRYELIMSDEPDYIVATPLDKPFNYCNYDCIRILFTGENFSPDFNVFDYAVTCDDISFRDRFYRFQQFNASGWAIAASKKHLEVPEDLLLHKKYFCDFIYKNSQGQPTREAMFHKLSEYKRVESGGTWLNNMPGGKTIGWPEEKQDFQKLCKFTIAIDSMQYPGFITEKITNAFMNRTIPIYLGAPDVTEIFNPKAFINIADYESLDDVLERVKYLDTHDDEYMKMIREPAFIDPDFAQKTYDGLVTFLCHIFDQDLSKAKRRYEEKFSNKLHMDSLRKINWATERENKLLKNRLKAAPRIAMRTILGDDKYENIKKKLK